MRKRCKTCRTYREGSNLNSIGICTMCTKASSPNRNPLEAFDTIATLRVRDSNLIFARNAELEIVIPLKSLEVFRVNPPDFFDRTGSIDIVFVEPGGTARTIFRVNLLSVGELEYAKNIEKYITSNAEVALSLT